MPHPSAADWHLSTLAAGQRIVKEMLELAMLLAFRSPKPLYGETFLVKNRHINHRGFTPYQSVLGKLLASVSMKRYLILKMDSAKGFKSGKQPRLPVQRSTHSRGSEQPCQEVRALERSVLTWRPGTSTFLQKEQMWTCQDHPQGIACKCLVGSCRRPYRRACDEPTALDANRGLRQAAS